jgi:prepilin-type N-terminal cleavage/methylation domain-containing protein
MKTKKGLTLIEVVVTTVIVGIMGLGTIQIIANSNRIFNNSAKQSTINSNVNSLMFDISRDIKSGYKLDTGGYDYSYVLNITKRNTDTNLDEVITWTYKYVYESDTNYGYYPARTAADGTEKIYKIIGGNTINGYKQVFLSFQYPNNYDRLNPGKYYGVDVNVYTWTSNLSWTDYWSNQTQATFYCRTEPESILGI